MRPFRSVIPDTNRTFCRLSPLSRSAPQSSSDTLPSRTTCQGLTMTVSLDPDQFAELVRDAGRVWRILGTGGKDLIDLEKPVRDKHAKSIVTKRRKIGRASC